MKRKGVEREKENEKESKRLRSGTASKTRQMGTPQADCRFSEQTIRHVQKALLKGQGDENLEDVVEVLYTLYREHSLTLSPQTINDLLYKYDQSTERLNFLKTRTMESFLQIPSIAAFAQVIRRVDQPPEEEIVNLITSLFFYEDAGKSLWKKMNEMRMIMAIDEAFCLFMFASTQNLRDMLQRHVEADVYIKQHPKKCVSAISTPSQFLRIREERTIFALLEHCDAAWIKKVGEESTAAARICKSLLRLPKPLSSICGEDLTPLVLSLQLKDFGAGVNKTKLQCYVSTLKRLFEIYPPEGPRKIYLGLNERMEEFTKTFNMSELMSAVLPLLLSCSLTCPFPKMTEILVERLDGQKTMDVPVQYFVDAYYDAYSPTPRKPAVWEMEKPLLQFYDLYMKSWVLMDDVKPAKC